MLAINCVGALAAEAQIRIIFVGDSMADGVGAAVQRNVAHNACLAQRIQVTRHGEIGTGLARADRFHWPDKVRTIVTAADADLIIASFGLNDRTGVVDNQANIRVEWGNPEWSARYKEQTAAFLRGAQGAHAGLLWLGIPVLREQVANDDAKAKNALYQSSISDFGRTNTVFVAPWSDDKAPTYQTYWTDPKGVKVQIRAPDGIHFTAAGYDLIASYLSPRILVHLEAQLGPSRLRCEG